MESKLTFQGNTQPGQHSLRRDKLTVHVFEDDDNNALCGRNRRLWVEVAPKDALEEEDNLCGSCKRFARIKRIELYV